MTDIDPNSYKEFERSVEDIYESFPVLFREKPVITVMIGWHGLIADCANDIQEIMKRTELPEEELLIPRIVDIKEKYGSLRIILSGFVLDKDKNEEIMNIISEYEDMSMKVCEICGRPGRLTRRGWIKAACDIHE